MSEPRRRVVLKIELGADSWEDARDALRDIELRLDERAERGERRINVVSGGVRSGFTLEADEDVDVTHESYFEAIDR